MKKYTLWLIFGFALFIRLYRLGTLPFGFHEDEILTGYVGRFILLNGRDLYNNPWPLLYFNKFGDYYIILPMYIKGLFTFVFGVNEFAVRFPTALLGAAAVFPVHTLAKQIFKKSEIGLYAAFIIAITPWHVVLSRASSEGVMGATIFLAGIYYLLCSIEKNSMKYVAMASGMFLFTYFIYHPFRALTPLLFVPIPFIYHKNLSKRMWITGLLSAIFFFGLTAYIATTPWGSGRFAQTSITSELSGVSIKIQEQIYDEGTNNIWLAKTFHNKVIGYGREFLAQYLRYISPQFLFIEGGKSYAYRVTEMGVLYVSYIVFLIALLIPTSHNLSVSRKHLWYFVYLLAVFPIPAALTVLDAPNVHRSVLLSLLFSIGLGVGVYKARRLRIWKISLMHIAVVGIVLEMIYGWHQYSHHADFFNAIYRNDAQRELMQYISSEVAPETPVIMPVQNTMPLYYLFYTNNFDLKLATQFALDVRIDKINNITFMDTDCPSKKLLENPPVTDTIIIDSHNCEFDPLHYELVTKVEGRNPLLAIQVLRRLEVE